MNKLTIEECEMYVDTPDNKYLINVNVVLRQLAATMREVERLRTGLTDIVKYLTVEEYWSSEDVERMAKDALQPSKPTDISDYQRIAEYNKTMLATMEKPTQNTVPTAKGRYLVQGNAWQEYFDTEEEAREFMRKNWPDGTLITFMQRTKT